MTQKVKSQCRFWPLLSLLLILFLAPLILTIAKNKPAPPPSEKVTIHLSSMSMTGSASPRDLRPYYNLSKLMKQYPHANTLVVEWNAAINGGGGLQGTLGYYRLRRTLIDETVWNTRVVHAEWKDVTEGAVHAAGEAEIRAFNASPGDWKVVWDASPSAVLRRHGARCVRR
jgi:hypothetical protein